MADTSVPRHAYASVVAGNLGAPLDHSFPGDSREDIDSVPRVSLSLDATEGEVVAVDLIAW